MIWPGTARAKRAVVTVGEGRGFVVQGEEPSFVAQGESCRYVITAAHCLPELPPCISFSDPEERVYKSLVGPLGGVPTIWTECLFVSPIADIAVLGPPGFGQVTGGTTSPDDDAVCNEGGPQPRLVSALPGWFLRKLNRANHAA